MYQLQERWLLELELRLRLQRKMKELLERPKRALRRAWGQGWTKVPQ